MKSETVVLSLGSNMGLREERLLEAAILLDETDGICVRRLSSLFESEPLGIDTSNLFINACCVIETSLDPRELLVICKDLERRAGRVPGDADRALDVDIVVFGGREIIEPDLILPHPRFRGRLFVIEPLAEIMPDLELAPDGMRPAELCSDADCQGLVRKISSRSIVGESVIQTI